MCHLDRKGVSASATFIFDEQGRTTDIVAERYEMNSGELKMWSTPIHTYEEFGDFSYIRLRVTDIEYDQPSLFDARF